MNLEMIQGYMVEFTVKYIMENMPEAIDDTLDKEDEADRLRDSILTWIANTPTDPKDILDDIE